MCHTTSRAELQKAIAAGSPREQISGLCRRHGRHGRHGDKTPLHAAQQEVGLCMLCPPHTTPRLLTPPNPRGLRLLAALLAYSTDHRTPQGSSTILAKRMASPARPAPPSPALRAATVTQATERDQGKCRQLDCMLER